jgi:hypothetical protein
MLQRLALGLTAYRRLQRSAQWPKEGTQTLGAGMGPAGMLAGTAAGRSGCISVKAPDKPIVIELNINIKQEVVYRLAGDASQTIDKNKDIF